jgi:acyl-coenzyme A synthetase/AMP-(fatty) acid ligase
MNFAPIATLEMKAKDRPRDTAFHFEDEVWTYERLVGAVDRLARGFINFGLRSGDRVALHMMNRPEMLIAYYACFKLGLIAAPLRTAFTAAELIPLIERLRPALYLGEATLYSNVAAANASQMPYNRRFVVGGEVDDRRIENWHKLLDSDAVAMLSTVVDINAPAVLINTSGTTGQPKFVTHTAGTLSATAERISVDWGFEDGDKIMLEQLPLGHSTGLMTFLSAIHFGIPFILLKKYDADVLLDTIEQYQCTTMLGFPATYAALIERQSARPRNLQSLQLCVTAGDVCPADVQTRGLAVLGAPIFNVWGATEVIGSFTHGLQPGPLSRIQEDGQVRLLNDDGMEVQRGEIGELCLRGPNVFIGYWNEPGVIEGLRDGWYHSGDLMRRGDDSEVWFAGRKKDIIIRGGTNISPVEIENALLAAHTAVLEAGVVGVPDPKLGQRVIGFVKLVPHAAESVVTNIMEAVAGRLAAYKVPERLIVIDKLPRNALSKVDRNALAELAAGSSEEHAGLQPGAKSMPREAVTVQAKLDS